jgi:hypothetical protein
LAASVVSERMLYPMVTRTMVEGASAKGAGQIPVSAEVG